MSGTIDISFPKPGTVLTYADALEAYRELEGQCSRASTPLPSKAMSEPTTS